MLSNELREVNCNKSIGYNKSLYIESLSDLYRMFKRPGKLVIEQQQARFCDDLYLYPSTQGIKAFFHHSFCLPF